MWARMNPTKMSPVRAIVVFNRMLLVLADRSVEIVDVTTSSEYSPP